MNKTFIIAEVGPNHNGSLEMAMEYVNLLSKIDVNAIKFQLANPYKLYSKDAFKAEYQKTNDDSDSALEMSEKNQLSKNDHLKLSEQCREKNIEYMCTAFDLESLIFLHETLNVSRFKIPSGEIFSLDLLEYICNIDKPILLSTGLAKMEDINNTFTYLNQNEKKDITILHCISNYPAPLDTVNMNVMLNIKEKFGVPIGFSDHTIGNLSSTIAVGMGASVIEKHVTIDNNLPGPDHKASATIEEFSQLVDIIRQSDRIKGNYEKTFSKQEEGIHKVARKSIVSCVELSPGHIITKNDYCFKRPGTGISPMDLNLVLGKKVKNKIEMDRLILLKDLF